jgi:hypothetical protein
MRYEQERAQKSCYEFWRFLSLGSWEKAEALLSDDFEANFPQSQESVASPQEYFELFRVTPPSWTFQLTNSMSEYDSWEHEVRVAVQILLYPH